MPTAEVVVVEIPVAIIEPRFIRIKTEINLLKKRLKLLLPLELLWFRVLFAFLFNGNEPTVEGVVVDVTDVAVIAPSVIRMFNGTKPMVEVVVGDAPVVAVIVPNVIRIVS